MISSNALNEIIQNRRTIKPTAMKVNGSVPKEIIEEALLNATYAPNHGKTEPWHFVVFSGEALKALNEFQAELYKQNAGEKFMQGKYNRMKTHYETVVYSIAICYRRSLMAKIPEWEEICAIGCAVQNLGLSISNSGYGGMWSSGSNLEHPAMKSYLNLNETDKLLGWFLVGETEELPEKSARIPLIEKVVWRG